MNYDLLKLSKILPTLNGKKTIDVYQERLEKAKQAQLDAKPSSPKPTKKPPLLQRYRPEQPKKELKVSQVKSADRFPAAVLEEYGNLHLLLKGESTENISSLFGGSARKPHTKSPINTQMGSSDNNFFPKDQNEKANEERPLTMSAVAPSNFVFKKKKIILRDTSELDHIYQYTLGTGFYVPGEETLGLNGRRMNVKEIKQQIVVRQQKKYLKDLKLDPLVTFHSPYGNDSSAKRANRKHLAKATLHHRIQAFKQQVEAVNQGAHQDLNNNKLKTVVFDGTYLQSFEKSPNALTLDMPGISEEYCYN